MNKYIIAIILGALLSGCASTLPGDKMHARINGFMINTADGPFMYAGTQKGYHYFWQEKYVPNLTGYIRVPANEFHISEVYEFKSNVRIPIKFVTDYETDGFSYSKNTANNRAIDAHD